MEIGQLDFLKSLDLKAFATEKYLAITSPTWKFKDNSSLDLFLSAFEMDELGAMRDFAAVPTNGATPFFKNPKILDQMALPGSKNPISDELQIATWFQPIPSFRYFFAGDLSVSGDATGISLVHYDTFNNNIVLDFSKQVKGTRNMPVDYGQIRQLIYSLSDHGFNICGIAFDQFQSNDSINILINKGYSAKVVKYAESFAGCNMLHDLIHTNRFIYYDFNDVFIGEAKELQIVNSKRIDHLLNGGFYNSKDVFDSVVNATYICLEDFYERTRQVERSKKFAAITKELAKNVRTRKIPDLDDSWIL